MAHPTSNRRRVGQWFATLFPRRLVFGTLLVNAFVIILVGLWLHHARQQDERTAEVVTQNLTQVLSSKLRESISKADIALIALLDEYARERSGARVNTKRLNTYIEQSRLRMPEIDALRISNSAGELMYGTGVDPDARVSIADRPYFIYLRDHADAGLLISKPIISRVSRQWVVVFARRIERADGSFAGIAFSAIRIQQLAQFFSTVDVGAHGAIALRDGELGIIVRYPEIGDAASMIGNRNVSPTFAGMVREGRTLGTYKIVAGIDNVERTYSFRKLDPYPLYIMAGLATEDYLSTWYDQLELSAVLLILFAAITAASSWLLYRAWVRQTASLTELAEQEEQLRLAQTAFSSSQEGIVVTDGKGIILDVNPAFTQITGYSRAEAIGKNPRMLQSGRQDQEFYQSMWQSLASQGHWVGEFCNRRKNGEFYIQQTKISAVRDAAGQIDRYVAVAADVSQLRESQGRIEHLAYHDSLTNLPNRRLLGDRLTQAIAQADRHKNLLAVCYLDLDGFKPINDTWGHEIGDQLLIEVSQRLHTCIRSGDTVARLGGDEFVVLLGDAVDVREVEHVCHRILGVIAAPFTIGRVETQLTASVGVTVYPSDGHDADALIRHADQAMYAAKQAGKNRFRLFDPDQDRLLRAHLEVVSRVEEGLAAGEFCLYYQPKVDMRLGTIVGLEALLRWQHPQQGLLPPAMYLPVLQNTDFALRLDEWVLREALGQMARWAEAGLLMPVSVNLSPRQLQRKEFISLLADLLRQFPSVPPRSLELEILESTSMEDLETVSTIIAACTAMGVQFSLDDFGTGYSSLTYLRRLPTHLLKIDQSFVRDMLDDPDDFGIVEGVIGLAQTFHRQVIAEGVETVEHGIPLLHLGCDLAQGYGIARPMPAADVPRWIEEWQPPAEWQEMGLVRWAKDDFPLLLADIHHRRWVERMASICKGHSAIEVAPPLGTHQCRFGQWLYGVGKKRYGRTAAFRAIEPIHDKLHALASELLELAKTSVEQAQRRIDELYLASGELERPLGQLKQQVAKRSIEQWSSAHG